MNNTAGIGETKADTPIKEELGRSVQNNERTQKASSAEKAQKESRKAQGERALPPPLGKRGEEVIETAWTYYLGSSDNEEAGVYEKIRDEPGAWAYCFDDLCPIHRPFKEQSGWFPHGSKTKAKTNKFRNARREMLAVMEQEETPHWEKYRVVMQGLYGGTHRKFSPYVDSQGKEELVPLTRCAAMKCDQRRTHTHDVVGEDRYDFPFALSDETDSDSEYEEALLDRTNLREVGNVLKRGRTLAFIRTKYWIKEQCQHRNQCAQKHLLHDPKGKPKEEDKNIVLWRCYDCDERSPAHYHQVIDKEQFVFPFKDKSTLTKEDLIEEIAVRYQVQETSDHGVIVKTYFWEEDEWQGRTIHKFSPRTRIQPEYRLIGMPRCQSQLCEDKENTHTHWVKGVGTHYFTTADTFSDNKEEEDKTAQELMVMEETQQDSDPIKFVVTKATRQSQVIVTRYWRMVMCGRQYCFQNRQHSHIMYDPDINPKEYVRTIEIQLCQDFSCEYKPEIHAHREDNNEKVEIEIPIEVARMVYGTDHPTMHNMTKNDTEEA
ncbi:hypothetical protein LTR44_011524 [Exophiala sp. CCFEE 6388]|nr:hypothetical protein LTR44_011524 [Eurotiomycetes sp. CCFEE 6388]